MAELIVERASLKLWTDALGAPGGPVILVMGAMNPAAAWPDSFCRGLAGAGRFVVRYDHRDTGRSSQSAGPYTLDDLTSDALAVLDGWGVRSADVVGLSMGGYIGQLLAINHPSRVRTLTLISTSADHRPYMAATMGRDASGLSLPPPAESFLSFVRSTASPREGADPVDMAVEGWRACNGKGLPFDAVGTRAMVERILACTAAPRAAIRHARAVDASPPRTDSLKDITSPTLVIHGRHDPCLPLPHGEALAKGIAGSRLVVLEEMGHMIREDLVESLLQAILNHIQAH